MCSMYYLEPINPGRRVNSNAQLPFYANLPKLGLYISKGPEIANVKVFESLLGDVAKE